MKKYLLIVLIITTKICVAQNVGIGTLVPANKLQVIGDVSADTVFIGNGTNVPILQFKSNTAGRKIALWPPTANDNHIYDGLGLENQFMRYQIYSTAVDHAFFAGTSSTTSNELLRIKGNGNVGIGTSTPTARLHVADSSVLFTAPATLPAMPGNPPASGTGNRMMWYADKAAFRSGGSYLNEWDNNNVGLFSFASGYATKGFGNSATAFGYFSEALGNYSLAGGFSSAANGIASIAVGSGAIAAGNYSAAFGSSTFATGNYSIAAGYVTTASGFGSNAFGLSTVASGNMATATGNGTYATGGQSTAMGSYTKAKGNNTLVIGTYNDTTNYNTLFEIGNGTADNARNNAVTVLSNGNMGIGTVVPDAPLHVSNGNVLFTAPLPLPTIANNPPASGNGNRMMWYADKAAFRAGGVDGNE